MKLIIGKQNNYTYAFDTVAKTLTIKGILNWNIQLPNPVQNGSIISIYDVTASAYLPLTGLTISHVTDLTTGIPVYTLTWTTLPGGLNNTDTLLITVNATYSWVMYSLQQYQKA